MEEAVQRLLDDGELSKSLEELHSKEVVTKTEDGNTQTSKLDGSGVNIAFIDMGFDKDMSEFEGRVIHHMTCRLNESTGEHEIVDYTGETAGNDNYHGNTAADLAAGEKCGIAPKANVYFFEVDSRGKVEGEYAKRVEAILKYIEANMDELKLDIISHSAGASKDALDIADRIRKINGCEYVNSQICWNDFLPGREINGETVEAGFVESARKVPGVYEDDNGKFLTNQNAMAIPVEGRTSIQVLKDENGNTIESRKFNGAICGASFAIPQLVGYFALARQMNPTMSFENFVNKAREHAKNSNGQLFINPIEVIEKMWEKQRGAPVQEQGQEPSQEPNNTPSRGDMTQRLGRETLHEQNDTTLKNTDEQEYPISSNIEERITNIASAELDGQEVISGSKIQRNNIKDIQNEDKVIQNSENHDDYDSK